MDPLSDEALTLVELTADGATAAFTAVLRLGAATGSATGTTFPAAAAAGWRFITTHAPPASAIAIPPRRYQRYFWRGSGASMGAPSPPPGRLSLPWARAAPEAVWAGSSEIVPVPVTVKPKGWPG